MWTVEGTLREAIASLQPSPDQLRICTSAEVRRLVAAIEDRFLKQERALGWWYRLRKPYSVYHAQGRLDEALAYMPDPTQLCWLVPDLDDQQPVRLAFELDPAFLPRLLGACYRFEYYLIGREVDWLIAETDHNAFLVKRAADEKTES